MGLDELITLFEVGIGEVYIEGIWFDGEFSSLMYPLFKLLSKEMNVEKLVFN